MWGIYFFELKEIRSISLIIMLVGFMYSYRRKFSKLLIISCLMFFILGISLCYGHNNKINNIFAKIGIIDNNVCVSGVIERLEYKEKSVVIYLKQCNIGEISKCEELKNIDLKILVYYPKDKYIDLEDVDIGYFVSLYGNLTAFEKATNYGQFDEYNYYIKQLGYHYKMYGESIESKIKINSSVYLLKRSLNAFSLMLQNKIDMLYKKDISGIIKAMLLGEKSMLDDEIKGLYSEAGISHILAISGLHITLIGMTLYNVLLNIKFNMYLSSLVTCGIVVLYGEMTHFSISTNRAVVMMMFMLLSKFFKRSYDVLNSCCMSLIFILIQNPYMIENCGLQLSYLAIVAIMVVYPVFYKRIDKKVLRKNSINLYIEDKTGKINDYRYILNVYDAIYKIKTWIINSMISGCAIYVVTLPIIINNFYEVKLFSILINVFVVPTVGILLPLIILSLFFAPILLNFAYICAGGVNALLCLYKKVGGICDGAQLNNLIIGYKGIALVVVYYLVLCALICICEKKIDIKHIINKGNIIIAVLFVMFLVGVCHHNRGIEINMLDVGQGDCSCIITPSKKVVLIDCGSSDIKSLYKYRIENYLKYKGIGVIDYIFLSHMDNDHISGVLEILETKNTKIKLNNIVITKYCLGEENYIKILNLAKKHNINIKVIKEGDKLTIDKVNIECLYPSSDLYKEKYNKDRNEYSMVLYITYKEWDAIYTGDISKMGEEYILSKIKNNRKIDVLKVPHHGSIYSSHDRFVDVIKPKIALFSAGRDNIYGHPDEKVIDKYIKNGAIIFNTIHDGAIEIRTNGYNMIHKKYNE